MQKKLLLLALVPVLAAVGPVGLYTAAQWWSQMKDSVLPAASLSASLAGSGEAAPGLYGDWATSARLVPPQKPGEPLPSSPQPPRPEETVDLAEALRFDVTPAWVVRRWPWVSAGLSHLPLNGYRVPLFTGTAEDDLAGALTYYFNSRQQVQRITFQGSTGDAGKLIRLVRSRFQFARRLANDPTVIRYEAPAGQGPAKSSLDIRMTRPTDAFHRFHVTLSIERPA